MRTFKENMMRMILMQEQLDPTPLEMMDSEFEDFWTFIKECETN